MKTTPLIPCRTARDRAQHSAATRRTTTSCLVGGRAPPPFSGLRGPRDLQLRQSLVGHKGREGACARVVLLQPFARLVLVNTLPSLPYCMAIQLCPAVACACARACRHLRDAPPLTYDRRHRPVLVDTDQGRQEGHRSHSCDVLVPIVGLAAPVLAARTESEQPAFGGSSTSRSQFCGVGTLSSRSH